MKFCLSIVPGVALVLVLAVLPACHSPLPVPEPREEPVDRAPIRSIMDEKVEASSDLLHAIALRDLPRVEARSRQLADLSRVADWQVHDTVAYSVFSKRFRSAAEDLAAAAARGDVDRLEGGYVRLTETCLSCHAYLREEGAVRELPGRIAMR